MTGRRFLRSLLLPVVPVLLPLLVLGVFSSFITQNYIRRESENRYLSLLRQSRESLDIVLRNLEVLAQDFSKDPQLVRAVKTILRSGSLEAENAEVLGVLQKFVANQANVGSLTDSIYVYYRNDGSRFLSSRDGMTRPGVSADSSWFEDFAAHAGNGSSWASLRAMRHYSFETVPIHVVTLYRQLYSPGMMESDGVLVWNLNARLVERHLDPSVVIFDAELRVLFRHDRAAILDAEQWRRIAEDGRPAIIEESSRGPHVVFQTDPNRWGWRFVSIVPESQVYELSRKLSLLAAVLAGATFAAAIALNAVLTRSTRRQVDNMVEIIQAAEAGRSLPPVKAARFPDEYAFITQNLVKTFIERSYLKVQLSEREYRRKTLELLSLQSQINPHFLFNTLETLTWKAMSLSGGPNLVTFIIENLANILKYSLAGGLEPVSLEREIRHAEAYLAIMRMRYPDKFAVRWHVGPGVRDCRTVRLLLQPLLENAITHGIREKEGPGAISVRIGKREDAIVVSVADDGVGMDAATLEAVRASVRRRQADVGRHIGLANTYRRLQLAFGSRGCRWGMASRPGRGTLVRLIFPAVQQAAGNASRLEGEQQPEP